MLLIARGPAIHLAHALLDQGQDGLEPVRGGQARPQAIGEAQPMEREGLLEPFGQALGRIFIEPPQLPVEAIQARVRRRIGGLAIRLRGYRALPQLRVALKREIMQGKEGRVA